MDIYCPSLKKYQRFNTSVNGNLYVLSFALHPTRDEPTGTLNFSRILYKTLRLTLVDESKYTNNNYKPTLLFNVFVQINCPLLPSTLCILAILFGIKTKAQFPSLSTSPLFTFPSGPLVKIFSHSIF